MGTYKYTALRRNSGVLHTTGPLDQENILDSPNKLDSSWVLISKIIFSLYKKKFFKKRRSQNQVVPTLFISAHLKTEEPRTSQGILWDWKDLTPAKNMKELVSTFSPNISRVSSRSTWLTYVNPEHYKINIIWKSHLWNLVGYSGR